VSAEPGLEIRLEPLSDLGLQAQIQSAFRVEQVVETFSHPSGRGFGWRTRAPSRIHDKDYDALPENGPRDWPRRFDVRHWGMLGAWHADRRVGGAVVAHRTPELSADDAVAWLWDLRVEPAWRRRGVGRALFEAVERWACARGCRELRVETQNINAPACSFYAARGCVLCAVDPLAYPELPDEVQLVFSKTLEPTREASGRTG